MEAQTATTSPSQSLQRREEMEQHSSMLSIPQNSEKEAEQAPELQTAEDEEPDYISGFPLVILMTCLTVVNFLMLLDSSIIATVRPATEHYLLVHS
jgi:hypothetical protein